MVKTRRSDRDVAHSFRQTRSKISFKVTINNIFHIDLHKFVIKPNRLMQTATTEGRSKSIPKKDVQKICMSKSSLQ